jgi:chloramphenicol 3-O phosphotransferase
MIIIINGCPSAGKTSIAKELQKLHNKPLLHTGIDHFWKMVPEQYKEFGSQAHEGYSFVKTIDSDNNPLIHVQTGPFAHSVDNAMAKFIRTLDDCEQDIVVDEVFCRDEIVQNYAKILGDKTVYLIGITCDLQELERREKNRGNREIGLARGQIDTVHRYIHCYDFVVDSTHCDPIHCAQKIIDFIQANPDPQGIKRLINNF